MASYLSSVGSYFTSWVPSIPIVTDTHSDYDQIIPPVTETTEQKKSISDAFDQELSTFTGHLVDWLPMYLIYEKNVGLKVPKSEVGTKFYREIMYNGTTPRTAGEKNTLFGKAIKAKSSGFFETLILKNITFPCLKYVVKSLITDFSIQLRTRIDNILNTGLETYTQRRLDLLHEFITDLEKNIHLIAKNPDSITGTDPESKLQEVCEKPPISDTEKRMVSTKFEEILVKLGDVLVEDYSLKLHFAQDLVKYVFDKISSKNLFLNGLCYFVKFLLTIIFVLPWLLFVLLPQAIINKFYIKSYMKDYIKFALDETISAISTKTDDYGYKYDMDQMIGDLLNTVSGSLDQQQEKSHLPHSLEDVAKAREARLRQIAEILFDITPALEDTTENPALKNIKAFQRAVNGDASTWTETFIDIKTRARTPAVNAGILGLEAVLKNNAKNTAIKKLSTALLKLQNQKYKPEYEPPSETDRTTAERSREKKRKEVVNKITKKANAGIFTNAVRKVVDNRIGGLGNLVSMKQVSWKFGIVYLVIKPYLRDHKVEI